MRALLSLVLLAALALVGLSAPQKPHPARRAVPVLKAGAVMRAALDQVTSASPESGEDVPTPVTTLEDGLRHARKTSDRPIVAMAERDGWFFYATSVVRDQKTDKPVSMISGYAIKRGGRRLIGWGVW